MTSQNEYSTNSNTASSIILSLLSTLPSLTYSQLLAMTGMNPRTAKWAMARLCREGKVKRTHSLKDARCIHYSLVSKGRARRGGHCCEEPTCDSSLAPPYTALKCGNCGADCKPCRNPKLGK